MTTSDLFMIDTNILVYAYDENSSHHESSLQLIENGRRGNIKICLTPQILNEFYAVITDQKKVNQPFTQSDALTEMRKFYLSNHIIRNQINNM